MRLSKDEIDEANARMVERHPLYYSDTTIGDIFPFLKWLSHIKMPSTHKAEERQADHFLESDEERSDGIRQGKREMELFHKIQTQKEKSKKGFLTLGYGFVAYFKFFEFTIIIFTILTLLALPSMYFYWNYRDQEDENFGWMNKLQMGNLGYSTALCRDVHFGVGQLTLSWQTGVIKDVVAFGVIPEDAKILDAWLPNYETETWDYILDEPTVIEKINSEWLDKDIWTFEILPFIEPLRTKKTLEQRDQNATVTGMDRPKWYSEDARFFTQVLWKVKDEKEMENRKQIQLILVWTTIISALVYYVGLDLIDRYSEAQLEEYDMLTTTSSDFTAIYKIPPPLFENFKQNIYPKFNEFLYATKKKSYPVIAAFKVFLMDGMSKSLADEMKKNNETFADRVSNELFFYQSKANESHSHKFESDSEEEKEVKLEERDMTPQNRIISHPVSLKNMGLKRLDSNKTVQEGLNSKRMNFIKKEGSPSSLSEYANRSKDFQIADINFSFKNREVLYLLAERGHAIWSNSQESKVLIEKEINELIRRNHDTFTTPVSAFITFSNEESYLLATEFNKVRIGTKEVYKKYWQGHPLYFKPALEPSSILWENQYVPESEKFWKLIVSLIIVSLILFTSFCLLFYAQKEIYDYMNIYPYIEWDSVVKTYGDSLEHFAVLEWTYLKNTLQTNDLTSSTGTLSWFWQKYSNENGILATLNKEFFTQSKVKQEYVGGQVWYDWQSGNTLLTFLDIVITLVIVFADIILRNMVVILIRWVHFRSYNVEWVTIQVILFVSEYLNNGLALMLVGMNLDEFIGGHVMFLDGRYPDFTNRWFKELANFFITPMYINIFVPFLEFGIVYLLYTLSKWHDRGWSRDTYATKCKSMGQYITKMSGPENDIFDNYSYIMTIVWINMYFGVGLPLLFPLTLISLVSLYVFEKFLTVYWYKKSPMLNDRLNKNAIKTMKWSVHLYTLAGFWFLTNRQIFYDDVAPKARRSDIELTNHTFGNIEIDRTFPLLIFSILLFLYMVFYNMFSFVWDLIQSDTMNIYLRSVENLYSYYDSLDHHDLKTIILEEENNRQNLGYSKLTDTSLKEYKMSRLKRRRSTKIMSKEETDILRDKTIFNQFWYDLLMDTRYIDLFQYTPVIYRDINQPFKQEYIDSNYCRKWVDLAYWYLNEPEKLEQSEIDQRATIHRRFDYYTKNMRTLSVKTGGGLD
jgi:hypothetical protein